MNLNQLPIDTTKGFMPGNEGRRLFEIALKAGKHGPCLEIGSYCGKSTLYLGCACKKNRTILFSIDHHRGSEEHQPGQSYYDSDLFDPHTGQVDTFSVFRQTLENADLTDTVVPMVCRSEVAARCWATPLGLVFIDGGHSYDAAYTDYTVWERHITPGGFLVIHDIFMDPAQGGQAPRRVYQLARSSGRYRPLPMVETLGILQRR